MDTNKLHLSAGIAAKISELLSEPFARENGFVDLNLDQVGKLLEDAREQLAAAEPSADLDAAKASHEKCVNAYCMILMELESEQIPLPEIPLFDLTQRDEGTQILTDLMPRETDDTPPMTPSFAPTSEPAPLFPDLKEEEIQITPEAVTGGTFEDPSVGTAPESVSLVEEEDLELAIKEEQAYEEVMTTRGSPHEAELKSLMAKLVGQGTRDHLELALYFQLVKGGSFPFSPDVADRLSGQSFSFALETEAFARILPTIKEMWSQREGAIRGLLDAGNRRFELHPALKKHLDSLAKAHAGWLPDGRFPYAQTLSSLRYILATLAPDNFQPSLLDVAIVLFFFGQNKTLDGVALKNIIGADGLSANELVELAFRLSRVQRFRSRIFQASAALSENELDQVQSDLKRIFGLFTGLHLGGAGLKKVA